MLVKASLRSVCLSLGMMLFIPDLYAAPVDKKEAVMIESLFSKTKPQCVGIYVMDVPESLNNGTHKAFYDDFNIESKFIYPPAFKQRIALREETLRNQKTSQENAPVLKDVIRLPDGQGVIFDRNIPAQDDLGRILEAHVYLNNIAFVITANINDFSSPKYAERKKLYISAGFTETELNDKATKLAAMNSLISRLRGRADHDIPSEKGWCIPNGFITDDGVQHKIEAGLSYENDDFLLGINADNTIIDNSDTLFGRSKEINDALKFSGMKTLKKYASIVNDIPFEAWLFNGAKNYEQERRQFYDFILYANESVASTSKLLAAIVLNSQRKKTRYSEAQMVEIWDRIVGSLRYKPNAF